MVKSLCLISYTDWMRIWEGDMAIPSRPILPFPPLISFPSRGIFKFSCGRVGQKKVGRGYGVLASREFLCRLRSKTAHRDHCVWRLSVCLAGSHTLLVVTHSCFAGDTCIPRNATTMFIKMRLAFA